MEGVQRIYQKKNFGREEEEGKEKEEEGRREKGKEDGVWGEWEDCFLLIVMIGQRVGGGANAASDNVQDKEQNESFSF